ncbi:TPA: glycine zipper family protein [Vibrio parahaemolyticus]|uniref:glycine zipper family protein n=1 Tax=Vibrio parahaemolyticus TaxID=670 RepID=UPI000A3B850F|nr:glycine zipper family protein [Vibrio parahaemolyticus]MDF4973222.1 glycine zipper family protein [Vibrio parahaemolyticus]MDF5011781.1 glycine zipper family protein [Vibrio parahaemolyticus]MDF5035780.1 glycine zipper family protein [Vibrio parahaemolyticus]MDF5219971.1 glycine zipper family protein [Vibrio parahaemolyticus]MDF5685048.1 glycine zipper family protein [Vibrio parahaemolyticus]
MYKPLLLVVLSSSLAACAYNQKPVVDMTNVDQAQYEQDFAYCQGYAEKVDKTEAAKSEATNGAMTGALIGAAAGALEDGIGGAAVGAVAGSAVGAGAGALGGANDSTKTQAFVLRKCLQNKGYTVYDLD